MRSHSTVKLVTRGHPHEVPPWGAWHPITAGAGLAFFGGFQVLSNWQLDVTLLDQQACRRRMCRLTLVLRGLAHRDPMGPFSLGGIVPPPFRTLLKPGLGNLDPPDTHKENKKDNRKHKESNGKQLKTQGPQGKTIETITKTTENHRTTIENIRKIIENSSNHKENN